MLCSQVNQLMATVKNFRPHVKSAGLFLLTILGLIFSSSCWAIYSYQIVTGEAFETMSTDVAWTNDASQTGYPTDDDYQLVNIGFTFYLGEVAYNQVRITSNGALHFGADQGFYKDYTNEALPITSFFNGPGFEEAADRVIAGYWDDLNPSTGGTVRYGTLGSAPNRRFVASWRDVPGYNAPGTLYNVQIVLYENGDIRFRYGPGDATGSSATIGIEVDDSDFTQYSYNTNNAVGDANDILWKREFPALLGASADCVDNTKVTVTFASAISPARASDPSNFSISGGITVTAATYIDSTTVELTTTTIASGPTYTLTTSYPVQSTTFTMGTLTVATFSDQFSAVSYANNDGSNSWSGSWLESSDDGAANSGRVQVSGGRLQMTNRPDSGGQPRVERSLDLSSFSSATLTYDYITSGFVDGSDEFDVSVSNDGGASYTILTAYRNDVSGSASWDISGFISANTRIRFRISQRYTGNNEYMYLDNITVTANQFTPCPGIDHYLIALTTPTVTCEGASVVISAVDASNTPIDIPAGTTVTLSTDLANDGWLNPASVNSPSYTLLTDSASLTYQLYRFTPATLEVDVDDSNGATDDDGIRDDDFITFNSTGFKFYADGVADNIGLQIAGKTSNLAPNAQAITIRAIETDPATGRCDALINGASADIGFAYQCSDPATCAITNNGMAVNGSATIDDVVTGYTPVSVAFDATGTGSIDFDYFDVGQISLQASAALSTNSGTVTVTGGSNTFTVRPFAWDIQINGDPYADDATDPVYTTAGTSFNMSLRSVLWEAADDTDNDGVPDPFIDTNGDAIPDSGGDLSNNGITPNISQISGQVTLSPVPLVVAAPGNLSTVNFNLSDYLPAGNPSVATYTFAQSWDEVGILQINALTTDFMGAIGENISGQRINIGRFIPHHFNLLAPTIVEQCGTFTYAGYFDGVNALLDHNGQTFGFSNTISAVNAAGNVTLNYQGAFAKLTNADFTIQPFNVDTSANATGRVNATLASLSFAAGTATYTYSNVDYQYDALASPFNLRLDLSASDADSVSSGVVSSNAFNTRLGRMVLIDSYGPELGDLEMRLKTEYFDGTSWALNTDDSCSTYIQTNASFDPASYTVNLNAGETSIFSPASSQSLVNGISSLANGIWFTAPGENNYGSVKINFDLLGQGWLQFDWDGDNTLDTTSGTLNFGYYRGSDRVIYWREIKN